MKILILSDCDHLIKYILFGDEEIFEKKEKKQRDEIRHIPGNKLWPGSKLISNDDNEDWLKDDEKIIPENNMELAIYHCKGKFNYIKPNSTELFIILK
jgi:hypothetical protein